MSLDVTPEQQDLIDRVARLGRERFAPRAAAYDAEARFPFENYDDLREEGLLGLCVPKEHGGLGADFRTYCLVSAEMGRYCGATALTFNMHACSMMWSGSITEDLDIPDEDRRVHRANVIEHCRRVVEDGAIYAQPFSEGNPSAAGRAPFGTLARKVDGGWLLNGRKIFASLSGAASYYGILCTEDRPDAGRKDTIYLAASADADGFSITGPWDPLGMRGTVSRTLVLEDVFVPDQDALMPRGIYYQAAMRWPHMFFTLAPTYMGIAQAAYDFTVAYLRGEIPGLPPIKRRMFPTKQIAVAEMFITLEQTRALFLRVIADAKVDPTKDEVMRMLAGQYTIMENANALSQLAIRTCGGQSMLKSLPLERLYRDSRCGALMLPLTAEICLDRLGKEALYAPGESDD
ncbi:MAG: acyl-CoA dehydrogenase [Rhodospirillaceae bacterium]|nr:acyl-CoA dehydrogenase [Rhodospirillaceae bacterium]